MAEAMENILKAGLAGVAAFVAVGTLKPLFVESDAERICDEFFKSAEGVAFAEAAADADVSFRHNAVILNDGTQCVYTTLGLE